MLNIFKLIQNFGPHIWLSLGSIAGLLAIAASFFQESTFSMLEKVVARLVNLEEPIQSFNSWVTSYENSVIAVVGGILLGIGIYSSCRTIDKDELERGPRTLSPGTAWIGYALMQPSGAAIITTVVLITFIWAGVAIATDREEYEAINMSRFQHLFKQLGLAVLEILISLFYVVLLIYALITHSTKRPPETASNSK